MLKLTYKPAHMFLNPFRRSQEVKKLLQQWTPEDVAQYLSECDNALGAYAAGFQTNKITGSVIKTDDKLLDVEFLQKKFGIQPWGHRVKIVKAFKKARNDGYHVFTRKKRSVFESLGEDKPQGSITQTSVENWTIGQVGEWLKRIFPQDPKEVVKIFRREGIDGEALVEFPPQPELDDFLQETLDIQAYGILATLSYSVVAIKTDKVYREPTKDSNDTSATDKIPYELQPAFEVIKFKVKKNERLRRKFKSEEDYVPLCDVEKMMDTYLTINWQRQQQEEHTPRDPQTRRSAVPLGGLSSRSEGMETAPENKEKEESFWMRDALAQVQQNNKTIKVKLIISEIAPEGSLQRAVRNWLGPVLDQVNLQPTFGMFHTAICVGPWYIEWNTSEICTPRVPVSNAALITADIDGIAVNDDFDTVRRKLAEEICYWNTTKGYKNSGGKKQHVGNCQDFVEAIMSKLGVSPDWKGTALGDYFDSMKRNGTCKMEINVTRDFRESMKIPHGKFGMQNNTIVFETHRQLDEFVRHCTKMVPTFGQRQFLPEYRLLKGFDRAFWLRHYRKTNDERFKPLEKQEDPHDTLDSDDPYEAEDFLAGLEGVDDGVEGSDTGCPFLDPSYYSFKRN